MIPLANWGIRGLETTPLGLLTTLCFVARCIVLVSDLAISRRQAIVLCIRLILKTMEIPV
jgi:hypothetical protein